tara:strand:+ start:1072 stop:1326 length:255 start_codon:yes stop_codon:yes gene_type:complete
MKENHKNYSDIFKKDLSHFLFIFLAIKNNPSFCGGKLKSNSIFGQVFSTKLKTNLIGLFLVFSLIIPAIYRIVKNLSAGFIQTT